MKKYDFLNIDRWILLTLLLVWSIIQVIFVYAYGTTDVGVMGDPNAYRFLALQAVEQGTWYPNLSNYHDNFIFAPGYVNFICLVLYLGGSLKTVLYLQVLFNILIVLILYKLTSKVFGRHEAFIAACIYMLLPSNLLSPTVGYTELLFILLSLSAIYCSLSDKKYLIVIAGILIGLANWVRPLGIVWLFAIMIYYIVNKVDYKKYMCLFVGSVAIVCLIGIFTKEHFPDFNYSSSTGGWNLIMGANDDCDGGYNDLVFKEGNIGYLEESAQYTYKQRDDFYKSQAIDWVLNNPITYLKYLPSKIKLLFMFDNQYDMSGNLIEAQSRPVYLLSKISFSNKLVRNGANILYWFILLMSLISLCMCMRDKNILLFQIIVLGTTAMTLATVGHPRYHQVFMPYMIICASYMMCMLIKMIKMKKNGC